MRPAGHLLAGVARVDITPPIGIELGGFYTRVQPSIAVHDSLMATALVLTNGARMIALLSLDLLSLREPLTSQIRPLVAEAIDVAPEQVLIACSHTHSGPLIGTHLHTSLDDAADRSVGERYTADLARLLAAVARTARDQLQPARLAAGTGLSHIGINRRERLADGRVVIGLNEDGPRDPQVGVVRIDARDGRALAVLVSYACHPIIQGPLSRMISAEYPGAMRRVVEQATGATCLFLQGAAGDQGPVCGVDAGFGAVDRLGRMLGHQVLAAYFSLDTRHLRRTRTIFESVAPLTNIHEEVLDDPPIVLDVVERKVALPLGQAPSALQAREQHTALSTAIERLRAVGGPQVELARLEVQADWYAFLIEQYRRGAVAGQLETAVQIMRIGPAGLVALPVEPFVSQGLSIKARSVAPFTAVVGYANGCLCYVPTPEAHAQGGYEVEDSYKLYRLPAPVTSDAGRALIEAGCWGLDTLFA